MAVDTRNKRASVLGIALAVTLTLPVADGAIAAADRQSLAYCYGGFTPAISVTWVMVRVVDVAWTVAAGLASSWSTAAGAPDAWTVAGGIDDDLVT